MTQKDPAQRLKERDDIEAVFENETTIYVWNNRGIGYTGDFDPDLLDLLAELSREGHGVLPVTQVSAKRAPRMGKRGRSPDLKIHKDWSVRKRKNREDRD